MLWLPADHATLVPLEIATREHMTFPNVPHEDQKDERDRSYDLAYSRDELARSRPPPPPPPQPQPQLQPLAPAAAPSTAGAAARLGFASGGVQRGVPVRRANSRQHT